MISEKPRLMRLTAALIFAESKGVARFSSDVGAKRGNMLKDSDVYLIVRDDSSYY